MPSIAKMFKVMWPLLALLISVNAFMDVSEDTEAMAARSYFYVGGEYIPVLFSLLIPLIVDT